MLNVRRGRYRSGDRPLTLTRNDKVFLSYTIDLTKICKFFPVYDQGKLGSCTANGISGAYWFDQLNNADSQIAVSVFEPSRLYFYYKEREKEGNVGTDSGAEIGDGIDVLTTKGTCSESKWPYDIEKFTNPPPAECDQEATHHHAVTTRTVSQTLDDLVACLNAKLPVVFGFNVYKSFESIKDDGLVSMPDSSEELLGGHCVLLVGYDSTKRLFKVLNSWGQGWGDSGFCYFPEKYILTPQLAYDFYVVTSIVDDDAITKRMRENMSSPWFL